MAMTTLDQTQGLLAFVRSVQTGSFSAAARTLGAAPSAVSKAVARLEKRLGVRLLQRSTRQLILTQEGGAYFESIEPLLRALDEAGDLVRAVDDVQGVLRVSAPADLGRTLALPIVRDFAPRHPALHLEFSATDRPVDLIREGIDVAIRVGAVEDDGLNARLLSRIPLVLVASPSYVAARGQPASVEELSRHAHLRYVLNGRPQAIVLADGRKIEPTPVFDTDSGDVLRTAALNGLGVAQILDWSVREDLRNGRLLPLAPELPMPSVPVHALHAFGRHTPARARRFIDFLVAWFESMAPGSNEA
jgi:DNA-binding transcriptional LysR family regulator